MRQNATHIPYMNTLRACRTRMSQEGYDEDFRPTPTGLRSMQTHQVYKVEDVRVITSYRFEGLTNPNDHAIMYVIETNDGRKGTLVDLFGAQTRISVARLLAKAGVR
jgi:hypothetical protein